MKLEGIRLLRSPLAPLRHGQVRLASWLRAACAPLSPRVWAEDLGPALLIGLAWVLVVTGLLVASRS